MATAPAPDPRGPWQSNHLDEPRYLACLAADHGDLRDAAASVELTVPVPNCPGWTMTDPVEHVALARPAAS